MDGIDKDMISAQVRVGITWLADHVDDSIHALARNLDRLNVASLSNCPLGILFGGYDYAKDVLGLSPHQCEEFGFCGSMETAFAGLDEYPVLTSEWKLQVTEWITEAASGMVTPESAAAMSPGDRAYILLHSAE